MQGTTRKKSPPLKYHGGKHYLAEWIISHIPPHVHYVEPYFGGGSVLLRKPIELIANHSEVANDLDGDLMNFWTVLQNERLFQSFSRRVNAIPFSQPHFAKANSASSTGPVTRAVNFFIKCRQSRQGLGEDFATLSKNRTRGGMNEQASAWFSAVEGLPQWHERLKRVVLLNDDALTVIRKEDSPNTLFYLDPPYVAATRTAKRCYSFEMTTQDHRELLEMLASIRGKFLLSGYKSVLYDRFAAKHSWNRDQKQIDNKASSKKAKQIKAEILWMNF